MNFTINDIEESVRTLLLDTNASAYRYSPREICIAIRDGVKSVRNLRPESRYVDGSLTDVLLKNGSTEVEFAIPTEESGFVTFRTYTVNMDIRWQEAIVYYVAYRMYLKDDPDTVNNALAASYYQMFERASLS